jgi:hypothetical protein
MEAYEINLTSPLNLKERRIQRIWFTLQFVFTSLILRLKKYISNT